LFSENPEGLLKISIIRLKTMVVGWISYGEPREL